MKEMSIRTKLIYRTASLLRVLWPILGASPKQYYSRQIKNFMRPMAPVQEWTKLPRRQILSSPGEEARFGYAAERHPALLDVLQRVLRDG